MSLLISNCFYLGNFRSKDYHCCANISFTFIYPHVCIWHIGQLKSIMMVASSSRRHFLLLNIPNWWCVTCRKASGTRIDFDCIQRPCCALCLREKERDKCVKTPLTDIFANLSCSFFSSRFFRDRISASSRGKHQLRATGGSSSLSLSLALLKKNTPNASNKQSVSGMDV